LLAPFPVDGSVQTVPLLRVTSPVKVIVRELELDELKLIVPLILAVVVTVKLLLDVKVAPLLITRLLHVVKLDIVTTPEPVVAIMTSSEELGAVPPTQVEPDDQVPPDEVLVRVAALAFMPMANSRTIPTAKTKILFKLIFIFRLN
jgi:hypothetical protein